MISWLEEPKVKIKVVMRKGRKQWTTIKGLKDPKNTCKKLKKEICMCGGFIDDGIIFLQGEQSEKVAKYLEENIEAQ